MMKWIWATVEVLLLNGIVSLPTGFWKGLCIGLFVAVLPYYITAFQEDNDNA